MGRRTLTELLHLLAGVVVTILFAWLAAWAVPQAAGDIWIVAGIAMVAVAFMGIRPLRTGMAADRSEHGAVAAEAVEP